MTKKDALLEAMKDFAMEIADEKIAEFQKRQEAIPLKVTEPVLTYWYERTIKAENNAERAEADIVMLRTLLKSETERADHNYRSDWKKLQRMVNAEKRVRQLEAELRARCIEPEEITT